MAIRNTPNGDEYDKDVALGVYYAVNNAKIINMSFGKSFSPHSDWVRDAIAYAAKKDVLIVVLGTTQKTLMKYNITQMISSVLEKRFRTPSLR